MGILLDGFWMLHHDIGQGEKKDAVLFALTLLRSEKLKFYWRCLVDITMQRRRSYSLGSNTFVTAIVPQHSYYLVGNNLYL